MVDKNTGDRVLVVYAFVSFILLVTKKKTLGIINRVMGFSYWVVFRFGLIINEFVVTNFINRSVPKAL